MAEARIKIFQRRSELMGGRMKELEGKLHHKCWCKIGSLYGRELYSAIDIRLDNTIIFEVRYCRKVNEIRKNMKEFYVEYDGGVYDIFAVDFRGNEKQYVQLKANKVQ